jgi:hypothetical protein
MRAGSRRFSNKSSPMSYVACHACGNLNRAQDTQCFSCQADLTAAPPPPPMPIPVAGEAPAAAAAPDSDEFQLDNRVMRIAPKDADAGRFKDLASRYETKPVPKLDATAIHGLRSGLVGGIVTGFLSGLFRLKVPDDFTRLFARKYPQISQHPGQIFSLSLGMDVVLGLLIGLLLGFTNRLCWQAESAQAGAVIMAIVGAIVIYYTQGHVATVVIAAVHGWIMAFLISGIERKIFRGI